MTEHEHPPAVTLLWGERARPNRGPRPSLSVERIVAEATAIADGEGIAALTMPGLARRLGAGTMSLYRYVPGKDELIGLMIDAAVDDAPDVDGVRDGWREAVSVWAQGMRQIFLRHPWMLDVVTTARVMGPREVAWLEAGLRAFAALALPPMRRFDLSLLVNGYVRGVALEQVHETDVAVSGPMFTPEILRDHGRAEEFPLLMEVMAAFPFADPPVPGEEDARFAFGLVRLLDGIEIYVDTASV